MIKTCHWNSQTPPRKAVRKDVFEGHITDLIATHEIRQPGAQAFLVEQDPNWVTPPHFHLEHQFQVVVAGSGAIGRHAVGPFAVHYAAPQTGYGPITAGDQGIAYLTLRPGGDTGAWYLHKPGTRESMTPGLKREQQHGLPSGTIGADELAVLARGTTEELIPPRADGLAAHLVRLPADQPLDLPARHANGGRFYVVTRGALALADRQLEGMAVAFASADEAAVPRAGAEGAEVLVLQFPQGAAGAGAPA